MTEIKKILIMGAGTMGAAIAQSFAAAGRQVILVDQNESLLEHARDLVATGVDTMMEAGLYDRQKKDAVDTIYYAVVDELEEIGQEADLVLESVFEDPKVKQDVFAKLDRTCRVDCIFCSNTSASNVFSFVTVSHPERFLIAHWFNPAYLMDLVEVVRGPETTDEVVARVVELLRESGKKPCVLNQYVPGFIVNRLANAICREAGYMIMNGWTTGADIDAALGATSGVRYAFEGPLALNDVVGWDLILTGCRDVYASLCNDTDTSKLAEKLVAEGKLGLKSGSGIYNYSDTTPKKFMKERSEKIIKMVQAIAKL